MSAHTPTSGPWSVADELYGPYIVVDGVSRASIAMIHALDYSTGPDLVARANARLISSAPDLLAALEALVPDEPPGDVAATESTRVVCLVGELRRARAAIAKAVGK